MREYNIKPIETLYKGVLFRSRTEARWAVFFDEMSIKWVYEYEGYDLGNNLGFYLPDFFLPLFDNIYGCFAEVKGEKFSSKEIKKCDQLCKLTKKHIIMLDGIPSIKAYNYFEYDEINGVVVERTCLVKGDVAYKENRLFVSPGYENEDLSIPDRYICCVGDIYIDAVSVAQSYRF
jgi:hypothetical protein